MKLMLYKHKINYRLIKVESLVCYLNRLKQELRCSCAARNLAYQLN